MAEIQTQTKQHGLIFTYGTLKKDLPNYSLIRDLIRQNDAAYVGTFITYHQYPLVIGPHGIPYLINLPTAGHRVRGDVYTVSKRGVARLDELEGTRVGHYERLPIQVAETGGDGDLVAVAEAEAYFAHRSFGERIWERRGRVGLREYSEKNAEEYVRKENRPVRVSYVDFIESFLSNS